MRRYRINRLVIKPTLRCTADCDGCAPRRKLHRSVSQDAQLSLEQWKTILQDATALGLRNLHISGGEPTIYPHLVDLIEEGKNFGLRIRLNSNGGSISAKLAEDLLKAGLDEVCISIYSHEPEAHNSFRNSPNLWEKATQAVRIFSELKAAYPKFFLGTMSIILRENYRTFAELMAFHRQLGSQQIGISYLEGDYSGRYLLNKDEIIEFRQEVIPRLLAYCRKLDPRIRDRATTMARRLYGEEVGTIDDLSRGVYWRKGYCEIPKKNGLILANGEVHPCNIVEYVHEPIMGNLLERSFFEIWHSARWNGYRKTLHQHCSLCPVNIYSPVPLAYDPDSSLLVSLYHSKALALIRPGAQHLRELYKERKHRFSH